MSFSPFFILIYLYILFIYLFYCIHFFLPQKYRYLQDLCVPCEILLQRSIKMWLYVLYNFPKKKKKNLVGDLRILQTSGWRCQRAAYLPRTTERRWRSAREDPSHRHTRVTRHSSLPCPPARPALTLRL